MLNHTESVRVRRFRCRLNAGGALQKEKPAERELLTAGVSTGDKKDAVDFFLGRLELTQI